MKATQEAMLSLNVWRNQQHEQQGQQMTEGQKQCQPQRIWHLQGSQQPILAMQMKGGLKKRQPQRIWHLQGSQPTKICNAKDGGSKAVPTTEDMAPSREPATIIGNAKDR
eukprot:13281092-Ditylum_brightwellii.AAC.1